jgi:tRNA(Ile2) C34 agmatinyltransferase TiaS
MGDIADLMLNGDICDQCGVELEGEGMGFPRRCTGCGGKTPEETWDDEDEDVS